MKLITKLLQEEIGKASPHGDWNSETKNFLEDTSAKVCSKGFENNKWTLITEKCRRKGIPPRNLAVVNNTNLLPTSNRYKKLTNLQDTLPTDNTSRTQDERNTSDIPLTKRYNQSKGRIQRIDKSNREDHQVYYIPTLLNGRTENKSRETVQS